MKTAAFGVAVCLLAVAGTGCTMPSSKRIVSPQQAGQIQRVEYGTVQKINEVVIGGQRSQIGLYGGGATGVAATGNVGRGVGNDLAQVGGGVVGAIAGQAVEEAVTRKDAREFVVKMDNGAVVVVTQALPANFDVGQRVGVASGPGGARMIEP